MPSAGAAPFQDGQVGGWSRLSFAVLLSCVGSSPSASGVAALCAPFPQLSIRSLGVGFSILWRDMFPIGFLFLKLLLLLVGGLGSLVNMSLVLWALRVS